MVAETFSKAEAGTQKTAIDGMRVSDQLCQALIEEINSGTVQVGEPLPTERELCERFNASRPTVREALSLMQIKGYVDTEPGKRPRAAKPSIEQIVRSAGELIRNLLSDDEIGAHVEQMRQFVEIGAVREAAKRATNLQIAQIKATLEANFKAIESDDFPATDIAFHRSIVAVIGNPLILTLHDMFVSSMVKLRPAERDIIEHNQMVYEEHRQLYEAILAGDVNEAAIIIDRHLARSYRSRLAPPAKVEGLPSQPF
ncbi:FCD domain-containing protein [Polycladidibacter hongkongensis]|uniref:FCD domain-containing protein n=1 Tax=Polycladidibacter hongkongensis TaxID=1647556 RepID=UPI000AD6AFC8|nr:FCD domain-containing protein [Pseudovibrio hongkongensis]